MNRESSELQTSSYTHAHNESQLPCFLSRGNEKDRKDADDDDENERTVVMMMTPRRGSFTSRASAEHTLNYKLALLSPLLFRVSSLPKKISLVITFIFFLPRFHPTKTTTITAYIIHTSAADAMKKNETCIFSNLHNTTLE